MDLRLIVDFMILTYRNLTLNDEINYHGLRKDERIHSSGIESCFNRTP
ncbi:hypothetical protein BW31_01767 [Pantoea agglomerans]|nr:hypothetical protein BW31_01767 [Pantoea agglomerans]